MSIVMDIVEVALYAVAVAFFVGWALSKDDGD